MSTKIHVDERIIDLAGMLARKYDDWMKKILSLEMRYLLKINLKNSCG